MGFFGDYRAIGKIYGHLRKLEPILSNLIGGQQAMIDSAYTNILASQIISELNEIKSIVETTGNTVKCADFQFMGSTKSIYQIIADTEMLVNLAKGRPF